MTMRLAPLNTNKVNKTFYAGQSGYPSIQSAVTAANAAGGGVVVLQPGVTVSDTIATVATGYSNVAINDQRTPPFTTYQWTAPGPYQPIAATSPGGPDGAVQYKSGTQLAGDAKFTRTAGTVNVIDDALALRKSTLAGFVTLYLNEFGDAATVGGHLYVGGRISGSIANPPAIFIPNTFLFSGYGGATLQTDVVGGGLGQGNAGSYAVRLRDSGGNLFATFSHAVTQTTSTVAFSSNVGYRVNGAAPLGQYLRGDGTNGTFSPILANDVPTLNQNTTGTASNITGIVAIANGGTNASTASQARTNLGLGSMATQNANAVTISGGAIDGTTIGAGAPAAGTFTSLVAATADINGGTVDGAVIGGAAPAAATVTDLVATNSASLETVTAIDNLKMSIPHDYDSDAYFRWGAYVPGSVPVVYEDRNWLILPGQPSAIFQERWMNGRTGSPVLGISRQWFVTGVSNYPNSAAYKLPQYSFLSGEVRALNLALGVTPFIVTAATPTITLTTLLPQPGVTFRLDASGGNITVNLPSAMLDAPGNPAPMQEGAILIFKRMDSSANVITLAAQGPNNDVNVVGTSSTNVAPSGCVWLQLSYQTVSTVQHAVWLIIMKF